MGGWIRREQYSLRTLKGETGRQKVGRRGEKEKKKVSPPPSESTHSQCFPIKLKGEGLLPQRDGSCSLWTPEMWGEGQVEVETQL